MSRHCLELLCVKTCFSRGEGVQISCPWTIYVHVWSRQKARHGRLEHPMRNFPYDSCCTDRDLLLNSLSSCHIKCRGRKLSAQCLLCGLVLSSRNSTSKYAHHQNHHCRQLTVLEFSALSQYVFSAKERLVLTEKAHWFETFQWHPFQESDKSAFYNTAR